MVLVSWRSPKGRVRLDVTGIVLTGAALANLIVGQDLYALGFGTMAGLSGIAWAIDGLRDDLADRARS